MKLLDEIVSERGFEGRLGLDRRGRKRRSSKMDDSMRSGAMTEMFDL